jgi:hypothetical protein
MVQLIRGIGGVSSRDWTHSNQLDDDLFGRLFQLPVFFLGARGLYEGSILRVFRRPCLTVLSRLPCRLRGVVNLRSIDIHDCASLHCLHIAHPRDDRGNCCTEDYFRHMGATDSFAVGLCSICDRTFGDDY